MNYGKYATAKKQKLLRSKGRRISFFLKLLVLRVLLLLFIAGIFVSASGLYGLYQGAVSRAPGLETVSTIPTSYTTRLYYSDGETLIGTLSTSDENRAYVTYENISKYAIDAFISTLDENFWNHNGVEVKNLVDSPFAGILGNTTDDNTTITQKLIKNQIYKGSTPQGLTEKITQKIQIYNLAVKLEKYTPKERVIEYYLNTVNFGSGYYGIQTAAKNYFGKNASELTVSEAAVLAPVASSPAALNPVTHVEANKTARTETLQSMYSQGLITSEQYEEALYDTENVYLRISDRMNSAIGGGTPDTAFNEALIDQVLEDLEKAGYSSYEATNMLYSSGLLIYTTQDKDIQKILDEKLSDPSFYPAPGSGAYYKLSEDWSVSIYVGNGKWQHFRVKDFLDYYSSYEDKNGYYYHEDGGNLGISVLTVNRADIESKLSGFIRSMMEKYSGVTFTEANHTLTLEPEASMVIMNPLNGDVLAIYNDISTNRQPGSVFMPLSAFLPAIDNSGATLASVFDDSYYSYESYTVSSDEYINIPNWYSTGYEGYSSVRRGIYHSMNVVAARCFDKVGAGTSIAYLKQLGFADISETADRNVFTALGKLSKGVSLLELTGAYSAIANDGVYNEPRLYTDIYDHDGNLLIHKGDEPTRIIKSSTAKLLTDALEDTIKKGTGTLCALDSISVDAAGKTGASENDRDLWFCGFTPYYCAGIWSGFSDGLEQTSLQYHKTLWKEVMEAIHRDKGCIEGVLELPPDYEEVKICSKCGNLAVTDLCDKTAAGNMITTEFFAPGTVPENYCTCHIKVSICNESGTLASPLCPDTHTEILLDKQEGEEIIKGGGTKDSDYCLTTEKSVVCVIHGAVAE